MLWGISATPPHPYNSLQFCARPLYHRQVTSCHFPKSWCQIHIFPQPLGLKTPNSSKPPDFSRAITYSYKQPLYQHPFDRFCVNDNGLFTYPISPNIKETMHVVTFAILEPLRAHCNFKALSLGNAPLEQPYVLAYISN